MNFSLSWPTLAAPEKTEESEWTHDKLKFVGHLKNDQLKNVK